MANPLGEPTGQRALVGIVAALGGIATIGWSLWYLAPVSVTSDGKSQASWGASDRWQALAMLAVAVCIAFGVTAMLRFALAPLIPRSDTPSAGSTEADTALRGRIAPIVLSIGSVAIVVLALGLIISFVLLSTVRDVPQVSSKIDTLLTGVFTAVLPVVATWVGTVPAFYFGSENFRQAAQNTREALSDRLAPRRKITDVMIPAERIARLDADSPTDAETKKMEDVIHMMSEAATRVIVFNKATQEPIYVIRSSVPPMPENWVTGDYQVGPGSTGKTIKDYLDTVDKDAKKNRVDAENFRFIDENATPEAALALMAKERVDDLFVTKDGQKGRVLGWAASHDLRPR
jgi:hypothetical protein